MTDPAKRALWLKVSAVVVFAFASAAAFSAYLRPDMLAAFGDILSFCAGLLS